MTTLGYLILAAILIAFAVVVIRFAAAYQTAAGSPWARILAVFRNSETILWARLQVAGGALLAVGSAADSVFHDPAITDAVHQILKPEYVPFYVIGLGFLTETIRRHRTNPDPVTGAIVAPPPAPKN